MEDLRVLLLRAQREHLAALRCRFGCDEVVGIFAIPEGCVCWSDPVQALCGQHALKAQSTGAITCVVDFRNFERPGLPATSPAAW